MEEKNSENKQYKLFREKSLEAVESPEALNDYLRVTSPGVWLVLSAVIILLAGGLIWSILGRIETKGTYAVSVREGEVLCYVPYAEAAKAAGRGRIWVDGREYLMKTDGDPAIVTLSEGTDPYIMAAGGLERGQAAVLMPVLADLPDGVYEGTVVLESLQPIAMLLR